MKPLRAVAYTACLGFGMVGHWLTLAARAGMDRLDR